MSDREQHQEHSLTWHVETEALALWEPRDSTAKRLPRGAQILTTVGQVPQDGACEILHVIATDTDNVALVWNEKEAARIVRAPEALRIVARLAHLECACPTHLAAGCPGGDCDGCPDCLAGAARALCTDMDEPLAPAPDWTPEDADAATTEGWGLFESDRGLEIERDDEIGAFTTDDDAIRWVYTRAMRGSERHKRALDRVRALNLEEYRRMHATVQGMRRGGPRR